MSFTSKYELIVGLEVHAQLLTESKLFAGDSTLFGGAPNSQVSPITLGHPGTLPKMNKKVIEHAIKLGLACHCEIVRFNYFARKHYFYPDLPKGYQVSQHTAPICKGGFIEINVAGNIRKINLNRIHMEEDAGKSLHDVNSEYTSIDLNRAGVPLLEIVTEPDIRSADEAYQFLVELRRLVRYLDVCDGNMEEGSLRCDANISIRLSGEEMLGTKVEVKNLNSMRNVKRAIESEFQRLVDLKENGEAIIQQTRGYDADRNITYAIRDKEDADDYRYFAEPDLTPFSFSDEFIREISKSIPENFHAKKKRFTTEYHLTENEANILSEEKSFADYFEELAAESGDAKSAANWMLGPLKSWQNENNYEISSFPLIPKRLSVLIKMVKQNQLTFSAAAKLLQHWVGQPDSDPMKLAADQNMLHHGDENAIAETIDVVLSQFDDKVKEYRKGKKGLIGFFIKEVMKASGNKADPKMANELLNKKLNVPQKNN